MKTIRFAVIGVFLALVACTKNYRDSFMEHGTVKTWSVDQRLAAYYMSFRYKFGKEMPDGSYAVVYSRLPRAEITRELDQDIRDLESILDYQDEDWARYLKEFGIRDHFERQLKVFKAIRAINRASELQDTFNGLMGNYSYGSGYRFSYNHENNGYTDSTFFLSDFRNAFSFKSRTIDDARTRGVLRETERFERSFYREFDHKEPDPNFPNDPNKRVWRSKRYAVRVVKYKIIEANEQPENSYANYAEIYRVLDGKEESRPAVTAFLGGRSQIEVAVAVIDIDKESDGFGYGLPDFVENIPEPELTSDDMFQKIFPSPKNRVPPHVPLVQVEIARAGKVEERWEMSTDPNGWTVPFSYRILPRSDNYNVRIEFEKSDTSSYSSVRTIRYVLKEWTSGGRYSPTNGSVIEYYKPKSPYDGRMLNVSVLSDDDTKKVRFVFEDGHEQIGTIAPGLSAFISERPTSIAYSLGQKRWIITDQDGDGKFERRREISPNLQSRTGEYSSSN